LLTNYFLKILFAPNSSATAQIEAIRRAAKAHVDQAKRCQMNEDVDRHLWGMLQLAKQRRIKFAGFVPSFVLAICKIIDQKHFYLS